MPISEADLDSKAETTKAAEDEKGRRERERRLWFSVEKAKNLDAREALQWHNIHLGGFWGYFLTLFGLFSDPFWVIF